MTCLVCTTKADDSSLVLFDGMNSCAEEEHVIHDNIDGVEDSDYSASDFMKTRLTAHQDCQ